MVIAMDRNGLISEIRRLQSQLSEAYRQTGYRQTPHISRLEQALNIATEKLTLHAKRASKVEP